MSEYEDDFDSDSDAGSAINSFRDSFTCLTNVKSNTPRARFDVHFYPTSIQLIQFSRQKEVSHRYRIFRDNVSDILRLPYSNGKHVFFALHLKRPIVGGNRSTTDYDFVVFNFMADEEEEISLDLSNPLVKDMFDEEIVESESISGKTIEIFETLLVQIFDKDVTTPAKNYDGDRIAPALPCTFWDSDEHFLYPLDDGFVNVWKYCQMLKLKEVKNVRFVRSQGRFKTFDFYIYPNMQKSIRRYNIGSGKSNFISCFYLEFKAIDQTHYDGLFAFCGKNKITISTNDFRESDSDTNSDGSESESQTNASESSDTEDLLADDFEAPDPYMTQCKTEGRENESESGSSSKENESTATSEDEKQSTSQATSQSTSQEVLQRTTKRRRNRSRNVITDDNDTSSNESISTITPKKRSLRIDSDEDIENEERDEIQNKVKNSLSNVVDSESE